MQREKMPKSCETKRNGRLAPSAGASVGLSSTYECQDRDHLTRANPFVDLEGEEERQRLRVLGDASGEP